MHPLLQQLQHTLLGRLRTKLLIRIAGTTERIPSDREIWQFLMKSFKENSHAGLIDFHLLHIPETQEARFPNQFSRQEVRATLAHAADRKAFFRVFVEGTWGTGGISVGCLMLGHDRPCGRPGYYAAVLTESEYPNGYGYISIAPNDPVSESHIDQLSQNGWLPFGATQAGKQTAICVALMALQHGCGRIQVPVKHLAHLAHKNEPPNDPECGRRLDLVFRRKMQLTKAWVACESVRLFDPTFESALKERLLAGIADRVTREPLEILVYWKGEHFIASDDYYTFVASTRQKLDRIPVVIMGDFPEQLVQVERHGGRELLPPVLITGKRLLLGDTEEFRAWKAKDNIAQSDRLPRPADLMAVWIALAEALDDEDLDEKAIHDFLVKHPIILGAHWDSAEPEVRFGREYRADFVLRANRALPTVRLVELERSTHRIFTRDLHETDEITHAVQQVNDWLRWWRQNQADPIVSPSRGASPEGLVVIGRSRDLTEKEREILAHNNQGRDVKVLTYDELLDDFGTLITHRLDDSRD